METSSLLFGGGGSRKWIFKYYSDVFHASKRTLVRPISPLHPLQFVASTNIRHFFESHCLSWSTSVCATFCTRGLLWQILGEYNVPSHRLQKNSFTFTRAKQTFCIRVIEYQILKMFNIKGACLKKVQAVGLFYALFSLTLIWFRIYRQWSRRASINCLNQGDVSTVLLSHLATHYTVRKVQENKEEL
jgi:hypothetical protein